MSTLRTSLLCLCALALGCTKTLPLTEIVVLVDSDMEQLDRFTIEVENFGDGELIEAKLSDQAFPRRISLINEGSELGPIHVTVRAYVDGQDDPLLIEPRREIFFVKDETHMLRVDLLADCVALCDEGEACVDEGEGAECVTPEEAATLEIWTGEVDPLLPPDAGAADGGGAGPDGGGGSGGSGGMGTSDGGQTDAMAPPVPEFDYAPSNFQPGDPDLYDLERRSVTLDCGETVFDSNDLSFQNHCGDAPEVTMQLQPDDSVAAVIVYDNLSLQSGNTLRLVGSRPVILVVYGDATIEGTITAAAAGSTPGAGGNGACSAGTGQDGAYSPGPLGGASDGGGGGGFGTSGSRGGKAGGGSPSDSAAGQTEGEPLLTPLRGGCAGGSGDDGGAGGGGGGALQISTGGMFELDGTILAGGGGGAGTSNSSGGGGGGGSGGAILLEGSPLDIGAGSNLNANGGGGGGGSGNSGGASDPGEDASTNPVIAAAGGNASGAGGDGGDGQTGGAASENGGNGAPNPFGNGSGAGGGGGGMGRIRLRGTSDCTPPGEISPPPFVQCPDCGCQPPTSPAANCTFATSNSSGYFVCSDPADWDGARAGCRRAGTDLARVDDETEDAFLQGAIGADSWLGGRDEAEDTWTWSSNGGQFWQGDASGGPSAGDPACGSPVTPCPYANWFEGDDMTDAQPDNEDLAMSGNADCAYHSASLNAWVDGDCQLARAYVCEVPAP